MVVSGEVALLLQVPIADPRVPSWSGKREGRILKVLGRHTSDPSADSGGAVGAASGEYGGEGSRRR